EGVDESQDLRLAAKVQRQRQPALRRKLLLQLAKDARIGPAETVDRLLVVAHEEQLGPRQLVAAQRLDQLDLQRIGVLKFIHEERADLLAKVRSQTVVSLISEQVARADQQVVEVQNA